MTSFSVNKWYNDLVVGVFFAPAFQAKNSQCRFDFSFGDRKKAVASLSTTLLYIEYDKYFTNSKYQPFNLFPFIFKFNYLIPFLLKILLCSSSWRANKVGLPWRASHLGWTSCNAENKGKLGALYFCWRGKVSISWKTTYTSPCNRWISTKLQGFCDTRISS